MALHCGLALLLWLALSYLPINVIAEVRPYIRWAQSNATLSLELGPPRGLKDLPGCGRDETAAVEAEFQFDRVLVSCGCMGTAEAERLRWVMELREDILPEASRSERLAGPSIGGSSSGIVLLLRKQIQHRWDRPFKEEASFGLPRDWKREDRNLPDEDEVELPRALNIRRLTAQSLEEVAKASVLVVAMRYPWCTACEEKDKAFVKVSKVAGAKEEFSDVIFGALDLREEKQVARQVWEDGVHLCVKSRCPLHVFKPDEPLDEPYTLQVQVLYEMDEASMMGDPMAGMPGHTPKGQTTKPNFEKFERELSLLLPPAVSQLRGPEETQEFRRRWDTSVIGSGVDATAFRRAARQVRGTAAFALHAFPLGDPSIQLWQSETSGTVTKQQAVNFDGSLAPLNASYLAHFSRVHAQPLLQNYTWDLKDDMEKIGMPVAVLWVNHSDTNRTNATSHALAAFQNVCNKRRGTNASHHLLCCVMDQSYAYYQREYGSHEPYPFPFFGVTRKLGFGAGDRFGYPFQEPVNHTVVGFFSSPRRATKDMNSWVGRVLAGRVPPSHESGLVTNSSKWIRGQVLDVVWKTYQREINGSTADVLLELYDDQRKQQHIATAVMDVLAKTLKDYADIKIARMEVSQNYVPAVFGRKQFSKETEFFWIPPSIATGEWTPIDPVKFPGEPEDATPAKLLKWFKKHTMSRWSLKEALETSADISEEVMGRAKLQQQMDDRAEEDKQQMIKKMMTTLKKEKGLVDVGEMMGLKKAADALGTEAPAPAKSGKGKMQKSKSTPAEDLTAEGQEQKRADRKAKLQKEEQRQKDIAQKDREKRKRRLELEKQRQEKKKLEEQQRREKAAKEAEAKRRKKEAERLRQPATPLFSWGQSKEQIRISVSIPQLQTESVNATVGIDKVNMSCRDWQKRPYILVFELREFIVPANSSWTVRHSEEADPKPDGLLLTLQKEIPHRWDRLAQNHSAVKSFLKKDWVQDDGDLEEEQEDVELPSGQNVKKVTTAGLDRLLDRHSLVVLASRFPWCDKCKEKDREFTKAARMSRDKDHLDMVSFAVLDAREEKHFARAHNVSCTDSCDLLLFKQDEKEEPYLVPGRRFAEEVQIDCYKHLLPVVSEVKNKTHFDRVTTAFDTAIVGFFHSSKSEDPWYPRFRAVARELRGHALFGAAFNGLLPQDMGIDWDAEAVPLQEQGVEDNPAKPLVLLFKPKEHRHVEFTGELTLEKLSHFSKILSLPLVSQYTPEGRQKFQELKVPLGMLWLDGESGEGEANKAASEVLKRLALRFSGHLVFVTLNNTRDGFLMRPFGLDPRRVPAFGIAAAEEPDAARFALDETFRNWDELTSFWMDTGRAFDRVERFCTSFLEGTLEASHESADLPPSYRWPGPGAVHEVVWKTFRESVYRTQNDVLLELYSPYRPQHRTHLMVLELVAEALGNLTTLKVARMDTANNYVLPEFGLKDKEKSSTFFFLAAAPEKHRRPRRLATKMGRPEDLPAQLLRFVHRETRGQEWDFAERSAYVHSEAQRRIRRLRALEKDYEKKMQDEWVQKEMEEFERYKRLGKFENLNI